MKQLVFIVLSFLLITFCLSLITPSYAQIGTIRPPNSVPTAGANPSDFVAGLIRGIISLMVILAFIIAIIWIIIAGMRFIFANGDPKTISAAWSSIYWGLLGLVIVVSAFAIIKLVEVFFAIKILSGPFALPTR